MPRFEGWDLEYIKYEIDILFRENEINRELKEKINIIFEAFEHLVNEECNNLEEGLREKYKEEIDDLKQENNNLEDKVCDLETENDELKNKNYDLNININILKSAKEDLEEKNFELKSNIKKAIGGY